jgi:hypothetical protein
MSENSRMTTPERTERRQAKRYPMAVPMRLGKSDGQTKDLSSRGVYFTAASPMREGTPVEMNVTLTNACARGPVTLHLRGHITRVDRLESELGAAVVIEEWDVTDLGLPGFAGP